MIVQYINITTKKILTIYKIINGANREKVGSI